MRQILKFKILSILFLTCVISLYSKQDSTRIDIKGAINQNLILTNDLESIINNPEFNNALIGVYVKSMETGEVLFKKNDEKNFITASILKLLTTSTALELLGENYQFKTSLYLDGNISDNGNFYGNIIIKGSGDPSMSNYFYEDPSVVVDFFARCLDSIGIKTIRGNIIGDDKCFDNKYYAPGWSWEDMDYWFSAQINGLSIYDNTVDIKIYPSNKLIEQPSIIVSPTNTYMRVFNHLISVPKNEPLIIEPIKDIKTNTLELYGKVPVGNSNDNTEILSITVDNPTLYFLNLFKESLDRQQLKFRGSIIDIDDWSGEVKYSNLQKICDFYSPNLLEIISVINRTSHNLCAVMILKTFSLNKSGEGSFSKGINEVKKYLSKKGIPPEKIEIVDGSGLSRYNFLSPKIIVTLLTSIYNSKYRDIFINTLAQPGKIGSLQRRMTGSRAEKNVYAKTGTMNNISNLAGYVRTRDGEMLAFCIMMMNFTVQEMDAQNLQDLICMLLASYTRKNN